MPMFLQAVNTQILYSKIDSLLPFAQITFSKSLLNKYNYEQAPGGMQNKFLEKRLKAIETLKGILAYAESLELTLEAQRRALQNDYIALKRNVYSAKNSVRSMIQIAQE